MRKNKTKAVSVLLCVSITANAALAGTMLYKTALPKAEVNSNSNISTFEGVTAEMTQAEYWKSRCTDYDRLIMTQEEITDLNQRIIQCKECSMNDLSEFDEHFNPAEIIGQIAKNRIPEREIFINGEKISKEAFYSELTEAIDKIDTSVTDTKFAVASQRCNLRLWPTDQKIGYSPNDYDDEMQNSSVNINEPLVLTAKAKVNNNEYYWAYSTSAKGWINADFAALCRSKEEWYGAWKVDPDLKNFIVVAESKISTEPSSTDCDTSDISLFMGTTLKLCPDNELPDETGGRSPLHSYAVYLPIRNDDGSYGRKIALIPQHYRISEGYLPMTRGNIIDTAFTCLGNRYGWGGMDNSMDCSSFVKSVYACFGLDLPRNTENQAKIPDVSTDISHMNNDDKLKMLSKLPACSLLILPNHIAMYIGTVDGEAYFINAHGCNYDRRKGVYNNINTIDIIPLSIAVTIRGTWLELFEACTVF